MLRAVRITILMIILALAAGATWSDRFRTTSWTDTLWIGLFPVNADGRPTTERYIDALSSAQFAAIDEFFRREAAYFDVALDKPVKVQLYPRVLEQPPALASGAGVLTRAAWSLKMRYYTWRMAGDTLADIRVFVLFHDPAQARAVPHSVGLQKGLLGVVYAYAADDMSEPNNIVIAHEVMHTLGATDKYDPVTGLPVFPHGYADPDAEPRYPQDAAEIMAGRTAISPSDAEMPDSLASAVVGAQTAAEINWIDAD